MHSRLEAYLSEVSAQLGPLPGKRREEELREMRGHLEAAYAAGLARGQSEEEEARDVLAQFGVPEELGAETVAAWRRGRSRDRRSFWGAAACYWLTWLLLLRLLEPWTFPDSGPKFHSLPLFWNAGALLLWQLPHCFLAGAVTGLACPKHGVAGTAAVIVVLSTTFPLVYSTIPTSATLTTCLFWTIADLAVAAAVYVLCALAAILGAWVGSRWRTARVGRAQVAQ